MKLEPINKDFYILWNIGKRCNYECSYCHPSLHSLTAPHVPLNVLQRTIKTVVSQSDKDLKIQFTGGEPTVNPDFLPFCEYIKESVTDRKVFLGVTTNGTRTVDYYNQLSNVVNNIVFSTHFEYLKEEHIDGFIAKTKGKNCSLNIMLEPDYWNVVKKVIDTAKAENIKFDLKRIHGNHVTYTEEQKEYIESFSSKGTYQDIIFNGESYNSNQLVNEHKNNFHGWTCKIGMNSIYIDTEGRVKKASCGVGGYLGTIYDRFSLPTEPEICDRYECNCIADVRIKKWKT